MPENIIQIDQNLLETRLDRLVAEKVAELLNGSSFDGRDTERSGPGEQSSLPAYFATVSRATPTSFAMLLHDMPCASSTLIRCCTDTGTVIPFLSRENRTV